jgi:hypothetical protein
MSWLRVLFFILSVQLLLVSSAPENREVQSITGQGKLAIDISRGASIKLPYELSAFLSSSFTFECWIYLEKPDEGGFKPIVYRGPGTSNQHNEFLLQVNTAGRLVFFMGNGSPLSVYGVLAVTSVAIPERTWTHVGFSIFTEEFKVNPSRISLYYGDKEEHYQWGTGTRQYRPDKPVSIGSYANPETHWFTGKLDEIRIWDEYRTFGQVDAMKNLPAPLENVRLKANYDCNIRDAKFLRDRSKSRFDGQILRASLTGETVNFVPSGVKIHQMLNYFYQSDVKHLFLLDKLENDTVYFLESLPAVGQLMDGYRNPFDHTKLPIRLESNTLTYDTTTNPSMTFFRIYGAKPLQTSPDFYYRAEEESTIVYIKTDVKRVDSQGRASYGKPAFCSDKGICTDSCRKV